MMIKFSTKFSESYISGLVSAGLSFLLMAGGLASGQTKIVVSEPKQQFSIAVPQECHRGANLRSRVSVSDVLTKDFQISGLFKVLSPNSYISRSECDASSADYRDWRLIKADWLVKGDFDTRNGKVDARFYLHDVSNGKRVLGKKYSGEAADIKAMGHRFANAVVKHLTGEQGPFGSKIAFSSQVGRFKELFVMDMDGSSVRQLTREKGLALSPAWNSRGDRILYTSYQARQPDLFLMDFPSGRSRGITRTAALEVGGDFSPDSNFVISGISGRDRDSDLAIFDKRGRVMKRFGEGNRAIDISPSLSPDGEQVVFCSDRGGSPQIYVMDLATARSRRVSFVKSSYCTSPDWSPDGKRIAYVCRMNGGFQLFVADSDGGQATQVTSSGNNEDPSWSPDGRYIAFASTFGRRKGFDIAIMRLADQYQPTKITQVTFKPGDEKEPSWGPIAN